MRYYLTQQIGTSFLVVGEVIGRRDPADGSNRPHSVAEGHGMTRAQLLEEPGGRRALWAWERGDDSAYAEAMEAWMREGDIEEVRMLAESGNRWARELVNAGLPDEEVRTFLSSDRAVTGGLRAL